jgi:hypothetical protein
MVRHGCRWRNRGRRRWLELRDLLFRKYQRKKLPWKYVEQLDKMLEKMGIRQDEATQNDE